MKIVAVVPIKLNNERLPGKNTKLLAGKPLIHYILNTLNNCSLLDEVYVYCSDESIQSYISDFGKVKFLKRPKYLDEPTSNFTQIFDNFSSTIDSDVYVFAHATAPYISETTINTCINNVVRGGFDSSFTAEKIQDYLWENSEPMNFDATNLPRSQDLSPIYRETSGVYVFTKEVFDKYRRRIGINPCPVEISFKESIDINYPKDFEMAELFSSVDDNPKKGNVNLLDCTLRDGGCVNSFDFGQSDMDSIKKSLESINFEYIELGYIHRNGSLNERTQFNSSSSVNNFLGEKKPNTNYVAMIDYGTFDFEELGERGKDTIDGIRLAFHKKDRYKAIESIEILLKKGYDAYLQPMIIMNYTDEEVLELVNLVNQYNIKAFYIVDSFGQMSPENVRRYFSIIDKNLKGNIMIGFHGHNNNQLAYANSLEFLSVASGREKILDCSLNGMGKGAGNLPSELIIEYLNKHHNKSYNVAELYRILVSTIKKYSDKYKWGYCPEFLLSAKYGCTPSFVSYFLSKYNVTLDELDELLSMLDEDKKTSSNSSHAEEVYQRRLKRNND